MAGKTKPHAGKELSTTTSTPTQNQQGVKVAIPFAKLVKYEVNVRSFHPNKNFERLGFRFHGDDRGFSVGKSWFGGDIESEEVGSVTSRIWQRYTLDMDWREAGDFSAKTSPAELRTESNFSGSGPGLWAVFSRGGENYNDPKHKPRGKLQVTAATEPHGGQKVIQTKSHYAGENHAFITSKAQQSIFGGTIVPTLDVFNELLIRVERVSLYMDIVSLTYGDGFPNAESFIKDPAGNKLFLGAHVRIGFPATHLAGEQKRLMWANAIRVEITPEGNFGENLWVFSEVVGGSPTLRDDYPPNKSVEKCTAGAQPKLYSNPFNDSPSRFTWDCGKTESIGHKDKAPLYLSAFTNIDQVRSELDKIWQTSPIKKITRTEWNNDHLHRNPNVGRAKDDYDVAEAKWKKQQP